MAKLVRDNSCKVDFMFSWYLLIVVLVVWLFSQSQCVRVPRCLVNKSGFLPSPLSALRCVWNDLSPTSLVPASDHNGQNSLVPREGEAERHTCFSTFLKRYIVIFTQEHLDVWNAKGLMYLYSEGLRFNRHVFREKKTCTCSRLSCNSLLYYALVIFPVILRPFPTFFPCLPFFDLLYTEQMNLMKTNTS